ncbi:MAG: hypothetical protein MK291_09735, partial [Planctomycetes bacterium]|nr:hypothetical protein [Planctomycetota bacterium]
MTTATFNPFNAKLPATIMRLANTLTAKLPLALGLLCLAAPAVAQQRPDQVYVLDTRTGSI